MKNSEYETDFQRCFFEEIGLVDDLESFLGILGTIFSVTHAFFRRAWLRCRRERLF